MAERTAPGARTDRRVEYLRGFGILLVIAVVGLYIVKWNPYFHRALGAAVRHTIGSNIILGQNLAAPAPSVASALGYAGTYFKAVWQAYVLGLLLAATIETLVPRDWVLRVLCSGRLRSSVLGGVLALPGMM
jgi:uncharacterized membrane protein YraQ (UPF0718 family)